MGSSIGATIIGLLMASIVPVAAMALTAEDGVPVILLLFAYSFSLMATFIFGLPAFLLLGRYGLVRWWSATIVGVVIGFLMAILIRLPAPPLMDDILFMSPTGAIAALVFWAIWKLGQRNPKPLSQ